MNFRVWAGKSAWLGLSCILASGCGGVVDGAPPASEDAEVAQGEDAAVGDAADVLDVADPADADAVDAVADADLDDADVAEDVADAADVSPADAVDAVPGDDVSGPDEDAAAADTADAAADSADVADGSAPDDATVADVATDAAADAASDVSSEDVSSDGVSSDGVSSDGVSSDTVPPCISDADCDEGNPCTVDSCVSGVCKMAPLVCAPDLNPCTNAVCDPVAGCTQVLSTGACNDKDPCTKVDKCVNGACVGVTMLDCADSDPCTDDVCLTGQGCSHPLLATCNDGDACTVDSCSGSGVCAHVALFPYAYCEDGNPCTVSDACSLVAGKLVCVGGPITDCDDGNVCTNDSCSAPGGCTHVGNGGACDDYDICTGPDFCADDYCIGGAYKTCADDGNPCTIDYCVSNAPSGVVNPPAPNADGCVYANTASACEDGSACTGADTCAGGACGSGNGNGCDDKNACTLDSCSGDGKVCSHTVDSTASVCDDGDVCSLGDACNVTTGACVGSSKTDCSDADPCTLDTCDAKLGCVHPALCDDANPCTQDVCQAGTCSHASLVLFQDDFSNGNVKGWTLDAEWQIGVASVGPVGNLPPGDPGADHSLSADNMEAGVVIGGIAKRETHGMRYLTSPEIDTTGMTYPALEFWRWLDADMAPYMVNTVEIYNGQIWKAIWKSSDGEVTADKTWVRVARDVSKYKHAKFRFRFGFAIQDGATVLAVGSWNIDDVVVGGSWTCIDNPQP
jgi:hypothetical protein